MSIHNIIHSSVSRSNVVTVISIKQPIDSKITLTLKCTQCQKAFIQWCTVKNRREMRSLSYTAMIKRVSTAANYPRKFQFPHDLPIHVVYATQKIRSDRQKLNGENRRFKNITIHKMYTYYCILYILSSYTI